MKSREGRQIPAWDAPIRQAMKVRSICADCVHVLDNCTDLKKQVVNDYHSGYSHVVKCDGYELILLEDKPNE